MTGLKELLRPETIPIGLCRDYPDVTPPDKIRYDACIIIDRPVELDGEVGLQEICGGGCAFTVHRSPFSGLKDACAELAGVWLPESGREIACKPSLEICLTDPKTITPEELRVEIYMPLEDG